MQWECIEGIFFDRRTCAQRKKREQERVVKAEQVDYLISILEPRGARSNQPKNIIFQLT